MLSYAELLRQTPEPARTKILASLTDELAETLAYDWMFWGRPEQQEPEGEWAIWLAIAGRGFGKTRMGAEWIKKQVLAGARRIALVAETQKDLEEVMVFGDSGIQAVFPPHQRPVITKKPIRIVFHTGALALGYNATEPDQLRGPQFDVAWSDELAKWQYAQETWDMLQFALRQGQTRQIITTTPRPIPLLKTLLAEAERGGEQGEVRVTRGRTSDNRANLSRRFLTRIHEKYSGTRLGRQELDAEVLDDSPDALWTRARLDALRVRQAPPMVRIAVAVDPAAKDNSAAGKRMREAAEATGSDRGAATGLVVCGLGEDGHGYVLEDATLRTSPEGWGNRAVELFDKWQADMIVGEVNNGGDMVRAVIRAVRPTVPFRAVTASRGKWIRAEPVAALYEQGRVHHVGTHAALEDEMVLFGPLGLADGMSPDRLDALVWSMTDLFPHIVKGEEAYVPPVIVTSEWGAPVGGFDE